MNALLSSRRTRAKKRPAMRLRRSGANRKDVIFIHSCDELQLVRIERIPETHDLIAIARMKAVLMNLFRRVGKNSNEPISAGKPAKDTDIGCSEFPNPICMRMQGFAHLSEIELLA